LSAYNDLAERALTDHTEIYAPQGRVQKFNQTGLWTRAEGLLLITTKQDEIVGEIGFSKTTELELTIGYRIYKRAHRGQGYMGEALALFSAYLFETVPHVTRLVIKTAVNNAGSRKLAEKCGYEQEGVLRRAYFYRGEICDFVVYSLLREHSPRLKDLLAPNAPPETNMRGK
jgi:RimJ/RimL family protein N-acetyltransferase